MKITDPQQKQIERKVNRLLNLKNDRETELNPYENQTLVSISRQLREGKRLTVPQASWVSELHKRQTKAQPLTLSTTQGGGKNPDFAENNGRRDTDSSLRNAVLSGNLQRRGILDKG